MSFRDFIDLADELSDGDSEEHWRTAISRAYYAAFHVARRLFGDVGFVVPRKDVHTYLCRRLDGCNHPEVRNAGCWLEKLRTQRNAADYDEAPPVTRAAAYGAVAQGLAVIRILEEVAANESVRQRIVQAMRDYERDVLKEVTWREPTA